MSNYHENRYVHGRANLSPAGLVNSRPAGVAPVLRRVQRSLGGNASGKILTNELLTALPEEDFARLMPQLETVALRPGEDLYKYGEPVYFAYFPESGVVSQLQVLADGSTTETAIIGREGMVGLSAVFSSPPPSYMTQVTVAGSAVRLRADLLRQEFLRGGTLQRMLLAYTNGRMKQLSQKAVCNGHHKVHERLCTWLLMVHDRLDGGCLPLTHEQIAGHMGIRRAGVTIAASALRDARAIDNGRGVIRVLDRRALEASACECYRALAPRRQPQPSAVV